MSNKSLLERARGLKQASIREVEKSDSSSVFVVNNMKVRGHINITVLSALGRPVNVRAQICSVPMDLSQQAVKKYILEAPEFRQLLAKKALLLINEDAAIEFLNTPEGRAEAERVNEISHIEEVSSMDDVNAELGIAKSEVDGEVNPYVLQLTVSEHSEDEALADLRSREQDLTKTDFSYLAANSRHEKVKAWAAERAVN